MEIKEELLAEELKKANISLILESYQDIFSDFDPRPFAEKSLSDDFLLECRRAAREKDDKSMEIILSLPRTKRNLNDEFKIKRRLKEHFHKHFIEKDKELTNMPFINILKKSRKFFFCSFFWWIISQYSSKNIIIIFSKIPRRKHFYCFRIKYACPLKLKVHNRIFKNSSKLLQFSSITIFSDICKPQICFSNYF